MERKASAHGEEGKRAWRGRQARMEREVSAHGERGKRAWRGRQARMDWRRQQARP